MQRIAILTYHSLDSSGSVVSVAPDTFAAQMATLAESGFRGISLREAVVRRDAQGEWPDRTVVLTFDDGYANAHSVALPVLVRHGFRATVFVVTGHVGGSNDWAPPPPGLGRQQMLSWPQVAEISTAGIEIGSHTRTHPSLPRLSGRTLEDEIVSSRRDIEDHGLQPVDCFAYPYGQVGGAAEAIVQREYRAACTTVLQRATAERPCNLPRLDAYYLRSPRMFHQAVEGQLDAYLASRRLVRRLRELLLRGR